MIRECPFCASRVTELVDYGSPGFSELGARVRCVSCDAHGPKGFGRSEAVRLWNEAPRQREAA